MHLYWALVLTRLARDVVPVRLVAAAAFVRAAAEGGTWRHLEVEAAKMALPKMCRQLEDSHNMSARSLGQQSQPNQEEGLGHLVRVVPQSALVLWRRDGMMRHPLTKTLHWTDVAAVGNNMAAPASTGLNGSSCLCLCFCDCLARVSRCLIHSSRKIKTGAGLKDGTISRKWIFSTKVVVQKVPCPKG